MAQNDLLKRYLDAGLEFTALTQSKAEALVKDLVKAGEVQADQARDAVADLIERSRKSSERLVETVREEVKQQITNLGLASQDDIERVEQRLLGLFGAATAPAKKAASKASAARKTTAKKAPAKKTTAAKKAPAKKSTAKKAGTKKAAARKTSATKASTTRSAAAKKA